MFRAESLGLRLDWDPLCSDFTNGVGNGLELNILCSVVTGGYGMEWTAIILPLPPLLNPKPLAGSFYK